MWKYFVIVSSMLLQGQETNCCCCFYGNIMVNKTSYFVQKKQLLFCQNILKKLMNNYISRIILITKYTDHFSPFLNPRFKMSSISNTELIENKMGKEVSHGPMISLKEQSRAHAVGSTWSDCTRQGNIVKEVVLSL